MNRIDSNRTASLTTVKAAGTRAAAHEAVHTAPTDRVELSDSNGYRPVSGKELQALCNKKSQLQIFGEAKDARQTLYQMEKATGLKLELSADRHVKLRQGGGQANAAGNQLVDLMFHEKGATKLRACHGHQPLNEKAGMANVYPNAIDTACYTHGMREGMSALAGGLARGHETHRAPSAQSSQPQPLLQSWLSESFITKGNSLRPAPAVSPYQRAFQLEFTQGMSTTPGRLRFFEEPAEMSTDLLKGDLG